MIPIAQYRQLFTALAEALHTTPHFRLGLGLWLCLSTGNSQLVLVIAPEQASNWYLTSTAQIPRRSPIRRKLATQGDECEF